MYTLLCFRVRAVTQINQTVKICGNIPELGNWNPNHALTLTTNENVYPMWINNNYLILQSEEQQVQLEFKCLIVSGDTQHWENTPNRIMSLECIKVIVFCTFGVADVSIIPLKKYSTESLNLDQDELTHVKKVQLGGLLNPFESDFNSSSDPESDFQSLLRSRDASVNINATPQNIRTSQEYKDFEYMGVTQASQREIEKPKVEIVKTNYSSRNDLNKKTHVFITNWEESIKKYLTEERENEISSRKNSYFSDGGQKEQSFQNLTPAVYEHEQLTQLFKLDGTHKLIVISFFVRLQKQQHTPQFDQELSPSILKCEAQRNRLVRIVKKMALEPLNTVIIVGCEDPYELDNMFDKINSVYLIPKRGQYVRQVNKNSEVQDLNSLGQQVWDRLSEQIRSLQENFDYITFIYTSDLITIDCMKILNESIRHCVMQEIIDSITSEIKQSSWVQVELNQNEIIVSKKKDNLGIVIKTIISHEIQTKGPIQLQLQIVYNAPHDDELFEIMTEIDRETLLRRKRAFSSRIKNIYLIPISKESKYTNIRSNSQFEMVRLLDKMTSEESQEKMMEDHEEQLMYS